MRELTESELTIAHRLGHDAPGLIDGGIPIGDVLQVNAIRDRLRAAVVWIAELITEKRSLTEQMTRFRRNATKRRKALQVAGKTIKRMSTELKLAQYRLSVLRVSLAARTSQFVPNAALTILASHANIEVTGPDGRGRFIDWPEGDVDAMIAAILAARKEPK